MSFCVMSFYAISFCQENHPKLKRFLMQIPKEWGIGCPFFFFAESQNVSLYHWLHPENVSVHTVLRNVFLFLLNCRAIYPMKLNVHLFCAMNVICLISLHLKCYLFIHNRVNQENTTLWPGIMMIIQNKYLFTMFFSSI